MLTSTAPTFQARPIQRQRVGAFDAEQFDDKVGQFGIRQLEVVEEPLEPFVVRLFFGVAGKGRRENREIDGPDCVECQQKAHGCASKFCTVRRERGKVGHREVESQTQELRNERGF